MNEASSPYTSLRNFAEKLDNVYYFKYTLSMQLKTILERLGLPKHSDVVYKLIEKDSPILASHIIRKSSLHRPAAYRALRALLKHNFIFISQEGKRKFYHAASKNLMAKEFSETSAEIVKTLAKKVVAKEANLKKEIIFLEGSKGISDAFNDVVEHTPRGETFYRYTSEKDLEAVNRMLPKDYREKRDAKKLERLVISNPVSGKQKRSRLERFIKFIPTNFNLFEQNIIQLVYGNRVSFIDLNTKRVIIIENKAMAEFQKVIFQQLYRYLPE